ncbi:MAG: hypothetical protein IJS30_05195 [Bacteroidales bacterium]|nr:hypothetical protein [Bacteroidales bacterium]
MKSTISTVFVTITMLFILLSCNKESASPISSTIQIENAEQVYGDVIVLGKKLNNPYSIANMQAAYDSLIRTKTIDTYKDERLEPNWLYVRFLPKDSTDVATLQNMDLELFDYPLDFEIEVEGNYYHDPSIPDDQITWQYTCVRPDFEFPDMNYEVLEQCYIPEEDGETTKSITNNDLFELEFAAISRAGLPEKYQPVAQTKALGFGTKPSGTILVYNDSKRTTESLRGAKIRCHYLVNISSCFTDADGNYAIGNRYICNPHYAIVYDSAKGFTIWGNFAFIAAANHNLGYQNNKGYDKTVTTSETGWKWAVINNAAYDFYEMCINEGLLPPPSNLKIWCWPDAYSSSAPMLHHLLGINIPGISGLLVSFLAQGAVAPAATILSTAALLINSAMPDITIGMAIFPSSHYSQHYFEVWHELFHASHFAKVGEVVWAPYINYIVLNNGYGDGTSSSIGKGICELGESWAFANQYYSSRQTWKSSIWFTNSVASIKQLLDTGVLTRKQIYDCLTVDVKSVSSLKAKLLERYTTKSKQINAAF